MWPDIKVLFVYPNIAHTYAYDKLFRHVTLNLFLCDGTYIGRHATIHIRLYRHRKINFYFGTFRNSLRKLLHFLEL